MKVIGIGDNVCDKYVHQKTMYPGGQALNFAIYASMLGAQSAYMGAFGTDEVAAHVQSTLDRHQVDRSHCRQYDGENGYARVTLVDGDRVFLSSNKGGVLREHPIQLTQEDLDYIKDFQLCHTSNNSYMDSQLPRLRSTGILISYDFSGRWTDESRVAQVAPYVDIAFLSCGSVDLGQAQKTCQYLCEQEAKMVVATRGSQGAVLYDGQEFYVQPPKLVNAVDTLGAGDSFATAFLLSWVGSLESRGKELAEDGQLRRSLLKDALLQGAEFSAKTCLVCGAFGEGVAFQED